MKEITEIVCVNEYICGNKVTLHIVIGLYYWGILFESIIRKKCMFYPITTLNYINDILLHRFRFYICTLLVSKNFH